MLFVTVLAGGAVLAMLWWFASLEESGDRHAILVVLALTLLVEALLAGPAADVAPGILRPRIGGQDFRPPDLVIVAALAARMLAVRGQRITGLALAWTGFLALYLTATAVGILNGFALNEVLFQGKGFLYIFGGIVIGSGADVERLAAQVGRLGIALAFLVPLAFFVEATCLVISFSTPVQRFNRLGQLSNDTITLLTVLGVVVLLAEATKNHRRNWVLIAVLALLLSPAAGHQRASYLVVAAVGPMLLALLSGKTWRRRSRITRVEIALVVMGLVGLVGLGFVFGSADRIVAPVEDAFGGQANERSAESRVSLADQALERIQERPILGWGNGDKVVRVAEYSGKEVAAAAHNILLDLAMRVGLVGLVLFIVAVVATAIVGTSVWKTSRSDSVAGMAVAGVMVLLAVLTKAMVEPALDKFRLSTSLGLAVGLVMAARRTSDALDQPEADSMTPVEAARS